MPVIDKHQSEGMDRRFSRRHLLQWMGGLSALLSNPGCVRQPREFMIPYAHMPEHMIPGHPLHYATAMPWEGYGIGLLAKTHLGRPIKIEGNPQHPASLGATDIFAQASVLSLYDPERARTPSHGQNEATWSQFSQALQAFLENPAMTADGKFRVVLPPESSPTLMEKIRQLRKKYPAIVWHRLAALPWDTERQTASRLIGRSVEAIHDFNKADVVVSFDHDFLSFGPGRLRYARDLTARRGEERQQDMNRLYSIHTTPSLVSSYADHALPVSIQGLRSTLLALAQDLGIGIKGNAQLTKEQRHWMGAMAEDLKTHRGRSLVLLDGLQSAELHHVVLQINDVLGNMGQTILWQESVLDHGGIPWESEESLVADLAASKVQGLLLLAVNPVYHSAYASVFQEHLPRLAFSAQLSPYQDETSPFCQWHIPQEHFLESWGDVCAYNGLISIIQPMIAPLFASKSMLACLQALLPGPAPTDYELVRSYWQNVRGGNRFVQNWENWLKLGFIPATEQKIIEAKAMRWDAEPLRIPAERPKSNPAGGVPIDLILRPDPTVGDGSVANNPWLQELPKPFSKLTWDHALLLHTDRGRELDVRTGDRLELLMETGKFTVPVLLLDYHPRETMTLSLGYGRNMPGHLGSGIGLNAFHLRKGQDAWAFEQVSVHKVSAKPYPLARTQTHFMEHSRHTLVRVGDWQAFLENPELFADEHKPAPDMEPSIPVAAHRVLGKPADLLQWGMAIDTSTCIGCNACVVACQAENNVPVVGKDEVMNGREMHWLRIDAYTDGAEPDANGTFQPVPCMHCETAPCELVCPVAATSHSEQGLNQMVYNRCVGTRYCSNNCPYKVRRFNFRNYVDVNPLVDLQRNPDVTVRSRGVMEKCTYCIQRINAHRIEATREGRSVTGNEVQTACAQACPTGAITFGNIKDEQSTVARWKRSKRNYELLGTLNTKPRTTYLAQLKNFNLLLRSKAEP